LGLVPSEAEEKESEMIQPPEGHFVAQYYLETKEGGLRKAATKIAVEETTGSWVGAGEATPLFKKSTAQIVDLQEIEPDRKGLVSIAFPLQNLPVDEYFVPSFWLFMTGGPLFERMFCDTVRLMDFGLPKELLAALPGPKFGMRGVREFLGLPDDEIVIATIVKPCAGLTAQEVADKCYEAAAGGIDFIKDDEKMSNPPYCPLKEKARLVAEGLRRAYEETGRKVIYCPHISTRPDKIAEDARVAVENGATGLMLNCFAAGFTAIQILAEQRDLHVPIYVHSGGRGAWSRFPGFGVDVNVVARMVRMLGGDFFRAHMIDGYLIADTRERSIELVNLLREPMGRIKDTVPALSGGLGADNLVQNLEAFGLDILPMAGGAVLGHPMGIQAGVSALRQAAESFKKRVPLDAYAKDHPELKAALDRARG
jgi:ribulose 1,5-bisphosphate carboxylase large subunit-like protein